MWGSLPSSFSVSPSRISASKAVPESLASLIPVCSLPSSCPLLAAPPWWCGYGGGGAVPPALAPCPDSLRSNADARKGTAIH